MPKLYLDSILVRKSPCPGDNGEVWTLYADEVVATTLHADGSFSTEKLGQGD